MNPKEKKALINELIKLLPQRQGTKINDDVINYYEMGFNECLGLVKKILKENQ